MRALSKFRAKGVAVYAEATRLITKTNTIQYADRTALIQAIQKPLIECKLEVSYTTEYHEGQEFAVVTVTHTTSGQFIKSYQKLFSVEVERKTTQYKEYMDYQSAIEDIQKQKTYYFRTMTLDILMISVIERGEEYKAPKNLEAKKEAKETKETQPVKEETHATVSQKVTTNKRQLDLRAILELYIRTANKANKANAKRYSDSIGGHKWREGHIQNVDKVLKLEMALVSKGLICDIKAKQLKGGRNGNSK